MLNPTLYSENRRCPPIVYIPFTLFAAIMLFVTSSHVDLLEQAASAHEETHARIGVHTNKISTIDRDNNNLKEGTGLRRSPMLVSEKSSHGSPGHGTGTGGTAGSTLDSPETRNSRDRSLAENSPWDRIADHWTIKFKSCRSTRSFPSPINFDSEELL